jgi:protein-disulfide isomerase
MPDVRSDMKALKYWISSAMAALLLLSPLGISAQFTGTAPQGNLKNVSLLRPPTGSKVAIVVFEDLACPACAHAHPIEAEAAAKTHVPLLRYDFPFEQHVWTFQGAVCARYIQKKINPALADQYRSDVFANQRFISNRDDLQNFTQKWLQRHGQQMPFVIDPDGSLAKEVRADFNLGQEVNVEYTPTVVVVTNDQYQVVCGTQNGPNDPSQILPVVEAAIARTSAPHKKSAAK